MFITDLMSCQEEVRETIGVDVRVCIVGVCVCVFCVCMSFGGRPVFH